MTRSHPTTAHLGVEGGQEAPHHGVDVAHVAPRHPGQLLRGAEVQLRPAAGQLAQLPAQLAVSRPQLVVEPHHPAGPVQLLHQRQVGSDARGVALVGVQLLAGAGVVAEGHHLAGHTRYSCLPLPPAAPCYTPPTCWPLLHIAHLLAPAPAVGRPAAGGALQADLPRARARGQPPLAPALLQGDPHLGGGAGEAGGGAGEAGGGAGDQYEQAAQQAAAGDQQEAPPHLARQGPGGHGAGGVTVTSEIIVEIMQEQ